MRDGIAQRRWMLFKNCTLEILYTKVAALLGEAFLDEGLRDRVADEPQRLRHGAPIGQKWFPERVSAFGKVAAAFNLAVGRTGRRGRKREQDQAAAPEEQV